MQRSLAQAPLNVSAVEAPAWKTLASTVCAVLLALLFLAAGIWKLSEPFDTSVRMVQARVPASLALFTAVSFGIAEVWSALLLMVPRFRRWGAWVTGLMLVAFMVWIGWHYQTLIGEDCSCFPWLKRAVGPGFFISDGVMLAMAAVAGWWAKPSHGKRGALIALAAIAVFGLAFLGIAYARQTGTPAAASIQVDGQAYSLQTGRHFLYFFDPECSHCYQAAKAMSQYKWKDTSVIVLPTVNPQFAPGFLKDTGLTARISSDWQKLKAVFPHGDPPYGVLVENGRGVAVFPHFEGAEPEASLRKLGSVE